MASRLGENEHDQSGAYPPQNAVDCMQAHADAGDVPAAAVRAVREMPVFNIYTVQANLSAAGRLSEGQSIGEHIARLEDVVAHAKTAINLSNDPSKKAELQKVLDEQQAIIQRLQETLRRQQERSQG